jgi:aminopeptidase-like protein
MMHKLEKEIPEIGNEMYDLMVKLYPICRSITGNGVRKTLDIISEQIPLEKYEIPTNTQVFDWTIPKEWNIKDAYVKKSNGEKIIDFKKSNLHVLNYSTPVNKIVSLSELKDHLFTLPAQPTLIPYRTSYYYENWGFCITHNQMLQLEEDEYEVIIDSTLEDGSLSYGEYFIKGESEDEVLLSCYVCHPSMCNDNLSGVVLLAFLAKYLKNIPSKYSYRFLFIPETIGAITWLFRNEHNIPKIKHGLIATCVGDSGVSSYKKSRQGNAEIDRTVIDVLKNSGDEYKIMDYEPIGSDERQFCSPGFNLPVGSLERTIPPGFPEYHTSGDDTNFVQPKYLADSFSKYFKVILKLEENFGKFYSKNNEEELPEIDSKNDQVFLNLNPKCEPKLDKIGLYRKVGAGTDNTEDERIRTLMILWVLNYSDGKHSLRHISLRSGIDFKRIKQTAELLHEKKLLKRIL